jgi:hypothetical protein
MAIAAALAAYPTVGQQHILKASLVNYVSEKSK